MQKQRHGKSIAREQAMVALYAYHIKQADYNKEEVFTKDKLANKMVIGVLDNQESINAKIIPNLKKWSITELNKVNLSILQLSIYEIMYEETPDKIVINEALEMAKKFSDMKSKNFIHNVLDKVTKSL